MKKLNGLLLGCVTGLLFSACTQDLDQPGLNSDGDLVRIQLDAPEAMQLTRSVAGTNSAKGGLTNVDWTQHDLRYQLAVYSADGTQLLVAPQSKVYDTYSPATFEFRLTPNCTYKFVAWADFVEQGTTEDLHYNTADFANISIITDADQDKTFNDESRDAFFITKDIQIGQTFNESLTLKRPFAKVRVVTTDWDENNGGIAKPDNFKITYHDCKRFSGLNAVSGEAIGETDADASIVYTAQIATDGNSGKFYEGGYDASAASRTLVVDYLLATSEQRAIHFKLDMLAGTSPVISRDFTTNIPIQRNYLTTLIGNLLSVGGSVTIDIDDNFDGENQVTVKDPKYIAYTATQELNCNNRFWGTDLEIIEEQCTYNTETGQGMWAYTGTVTEVEFNAFNGETSLLSITLPEGITSIGSNAFNNSGLEAITLPESLEEIAEHAFSKTNLTEIVIPANVELVGNSAFQGNSSGSISPLKKVIFEGTKILTIESNTFQDCQNLQEVKLPEGLKTIQYNAFLRCYALEEIIIPDAVTTIEKQVFSQCSALKKVTLGTQLESIGDHAFNKCLALEIIVCPDETPAVLGSKAVFPVSDGWGYTANYKIYVPDAQLNTYRTSWSAYWDTSSWVPTKVIYPMSDMP